MHVRVAKSCRFERLRTFCRAPLPPVQDDHHAQIEKGRQARFSDRAEQHPDFREKYAREREAARLHGRPTIDIADDVSGDAGFTGNIAVSRSRLRIDARKWLASKLAPKEYGDKLALRSAGLMAGR